MVDDLPDVFFGDNPPADWRQLPQVPEADDDVLLARSPPDVVAMLGFDPIELEHESE